VCTGRHRRRYMRDDVSGRDAATLLGMSWKTLSWLIEQGRIPHHDFRIDVADINAYIAVRDSIKREHEQAAATYEQRRNDRLEKLAAGD
jgi:hypothetical protein